MPEITKDNNTTRTKCGFLGNYFLNNVDSPILLLGMLKTAIKSFQLNFYQSNCFCYF